jgi:hypothetical protein
VLPCSRATHRTPPCLGVWVVQTHSVGARLSRAEVPSTLLALPRRVLGSSLCVEPQRRFHVGLSP